MAGRGFSVAISQGLRGRWVEETVKGESSHETILRRSGWDDKQNTYIHYFVRVEVRFWDMTNFMFDESKRQEDGSILPGWAEGNEQDIMNETERLLNMIIKVRNALKLEDVVNDWWHHLSMGSQQSAIGQYNKLLPQLVEAYSKIPGYLPPPPPITK
jgi:hypothetical protein